MLQSIPRFRAPSLLTPSAPLLELRTHPAQQSIILKRHARTARRYLVRDSIYKFFHLGSVLRVSSGRVAIKAGEELHHVFVQASLSREASRREGVLLLVLLGGGGLAAALALALALTIITAFSHQETWFCPRVTSLSVFDVRA